MGMLRRSAARPRKTDPLAAHCLLEIANNLRPLMRGDADLAEFKTVQVGADGDPINVDAIMLTTHGDGPAQPTQGA